MFRYQQKTELTPSLARQAERDSIFSSCCTSMGDVPFTDAAIIILYANMLGASDTFTMITTSLVPLAIGFFTIPAAWITLRSSYQQTILRASFFSLLLFGVIVCAPFFRSAAVMVLLLALAVFSVCHTVYLSAWFPMLDTFLTQERRSIYLGRMRFSWQLSSALLLGGIGMVIGKNPSVGMLQMVMLFSMCIFAFKLYFIARIPNFKSESGRKELSFKEGLDMALANKPLAGYSVYLFILNLAAYGTIPLVTLYMKKALHAPDNIIVFISSITLTGMLVGSFFAGWIIRRYGIKKTFLAVHVIYAVTNLALFFMSKGIMPDSRLYFTIAAILFLYSFTFACANISSSSEMMALANPNNKVMAMAFCNSFYYAGSGLSRFMTSLILGSGALAASWTSMGMTFCHYQTLFLVYAICVVFAASLLVVVPAIFPKGEYIYTIH
ncbi:MAG: Major Facilitator Superfamily protein [Lentisphaerae bacterium ADurb.Bin242]|nr:MAG: Major Facilitator Superfamily protein [Lentisphaerae bacterium ADurb.Bin242]